MLESSTELSTILAGEIKIGAQGFTWLGLRIVIIENMETH